LTAKALPKSVPAIVVVLIIALYSAGIEYGQWLHGSKEGLVWNAIDTACGALGGALAVAVLRLLERLIRLGPLSSGR
jgi:VanZ family protein